MSESVGGDIRRAAVGYFIVLVAVIASIASLSFCAGKQGATIAALRDTVRIADTVERVQWDTVVVHAKARAAAKATSDSLDKLVTLRDDSTVIIRDTVREAPPELIADNRALRFTVQQDSALIFGLYQHDTTRLWQIASRDKLYAADLERANGPRWGIGATCGIDPLARAPACTVGLTYQARIPSPKQILRGLIHRAVK